MFLFPHIVRFLDYDRIEDDLSERMSAMRKPDESELDYYERRYQERVRALSMDCMHPWILGLIVMHVQIPHSFITNDQLSGMRLATARSFF